MSFNGYINKDKLQELANKSKIVLTPRECDTFIDEINDVISFCITIEELTLDEEVCEFEK